MRALFLAGTVCFPLLCAPSVVCAQARDSAGTSLTVWAGALGENRRDAADSPLAYSGSGPFGRLDFDWTGATRHGYVSLSAGGATLGLTGSVEESTPPQEVFSVFTLEGGIDWRLHGAGHRQSDFSLGVQFVTSVTVTRHLYANEDLSEQSFDLGVLTLAPVGRWSHRFGSGELSASLAVPLVAFVDHPYADVRFPAQFSRIRYTAPSQYHEADGAVSYLYRPQSRYGGLVTYRLEAFGLEGVDPVHRVSQSLSLGIVRRFGVRR
jgi:hypothetical protein